MLLRKRAEIPIYSFEKHARLDRTTAIYSPHVLILEGIFALHDPRVLAMLDLKVHLHHWSPSRKLTTIRFSPKPIQICACREDVSCQSSYPAMTTDGMSVVRDVRERGRDIEGCIKQWFAFVKPNFHRYVEWQREVAGSHTSPFRITLAAAKYNRHHCATGNREPSRHWCVIHIRVVYVSNYLAN